MGSARFSTKYFVEVNGYDVAAQRWWRSPDSKEGTAGIVPAKGELKETMNSIISVLTPILIAVAFHVWFRWIRKQPAAGPPFWQWLAIAAGIAKGLNVEGAIALAKSYVTLALQHSYPIGHGSGPPHHFYRYWQPRISRQDAVTTAAPRDGRKD